MKNYLTYISPLAGIPSAWAIYAAMIGQPAFPMEPIWAGIGAVSVILVALSAAILYHDIKRFNAGLKLKDEQLLTMSTKGAKWVLALAIFGELSLSLVVVVIEGALVYGVIVFPIMTAAGIFALAIQNDMEQRASDLEQMRSKAKQKKSEAKAERKQTETKKKQEAIKAEAKKAPCKYGCGAVISQTVGGYNAHKRACTKWPSMADSLFDKVTNG